MAPELPKLVMLHGRWDAGKTFMGLTASPDFPALPYQPAVPPAQPVNLARTGVVMWENGLTGVAEAGISVGARIKVFETQPHELIDAISFVKSEMNRLAKEKGITHWLHDSMTAFDVKNVVRWSSQIDKTADPKTVLEAEGDDGGRQGLYRAVLNTHIDYYNAVVTVPNGSHIFICHSKAFEGGVRTKNARAVANATMKARAKGLDVNSASLGAALTGQAWDHYYRMCDIIGYVEREDVTVTERGMPKLVSRRMITLRQVGGVIARCRYAGLAEKEPADFRVLFNKITNAAPQTAK